MTSSRKCCTTNVKISTLMIIGIVLLVGGCVLIPEFPKLIQSQIKKNIVIKKGSQGYDEFLKPTSPLYMSYYVFDLQNEADVLNGEKPKVIQRGPYTYKEMRENIPVLWEDGGNLLTYLENKTYIFDQEMSCSNCTENDNITTPNIVALTFINDTMKSNTFVKVGLAGIMSAEKVTMFHKLTVKEIVFGYNDTFLQFLKSVEDNPMVKSFLDYLKKHDPALYAKIPNINPFLQLQYNGTAGMKQAGNTTIMTGQNDIKNLQLTTKWKGNSLLPFWNSTYGNMINGTDGTHFSPNPSKTERLYIFVSDVCRSLYVKYKKDSYVKDIKLQMYSTTDELFQNATVNKDNAPFCVPKCYGTGVLHIGQCLPMNPPILMSGPHFYQGDPMYYEAIDGLKPNPEKHGTFLYVEPYTGITMKAFKRLQVNIEIQNDPGYEVIMHKVRDFLYPIMYIEEHGLVGDADAKKFKNQVYFAVSLGEYLQYGLIALGGVLVLSAVVVGACAERKRKSLNFVIDDQEGLIQNAR
ncbi:lysosome membrane protein 2-like isoform X2 [Rhopilema esculentum]|uniref:lysosome membrane protein 2-like isoform X2 n=1 Tax=Rhopilema esculentum TaxID=499914 RepID=UPI0031E0D8F9